MKELWVDIRPFNKGIATAAIESGADAVVVEDADAVRELGRIVTIAENGDLVPGKDVFEVEVTDRESEQRALDLAAAGRVIVHTSDWTVIPLENLVSQSNRIIAAVRTPEEAELALHVLEKGARGLLLATDDPAVVWTVSGLLKKTTGEICLTPFTVTAIRPVGMGDRVCVDTCTLLSEGQGMLVGNTSSGFLLVHAETLENPYVEPRPFRVNASAVHAYVLMPDGRTAYLSELAIGDDVLVADRCGGLSVAVVGRVKIERRPLLLVEAESERGTASLILQNAETVRLVGEDGQPISVVDLEVGDRVLGVTEEGGRHFGVAVKETILEK
ncbi:MAG: 3-dehydroquinate synthase II [Methanomicrobiales archaeon]|nr:3-dehydroquinate synthase II [Methanomicrobiales archaeon]MDI6875799.1 3-dehydroquinate synthase II [Methanomicrobiales archaeon]